MLFRKKVDPDWKVVNDIADSWRLPRMWSVCPHCGQYGWRFPPHMFDPCPLVAATAQSAGLKMDAERMTALKQGVQLEQIMKQLLYKDDEEEEDDDDQ